MSVLIHLHEHPMLAGCRPRHIRALSVGDWMLQYYGPTRDVEAFVFRGEPSVQTDISEDIEALFAPAGEYTVLQAPGGQYALAFQVLMAVISVASVLMASTPQMPVNVNRTSASNNNSFGARTNEMRIMQRVEDIFGLVPAVPSLMGEPYNKYIDHRKVEVGYYCVSRGYCDLTRLRDGDTLISAITKASAAVYWPFTSPNSGHPPVLQIGDAIIDRILNVKRSQEVDGLTLKALNQLKLAPGDPYSFEPDPAGDRIVQQVKRPNMNSIMNPGDEITVAMSDASVGVTVAASASASLGGFSGNFAPSESGDGGVVSGGPNVFANMRVGDTVLVASTVDPTNDGSYQIESIADDFLGVTPHPATRPAADLTFSVRRNFSGTYTVAGVADGFIELTTSTFTGPALGAADIDVVATVPVSEWTDWFEQSIKDQTESWFNITAPQGMYKDNGGKSVATVEVEWQIEKLDPATLAPTGVIETVTGTLSGSVTEERAESVEHVTAWTGPRRTRARRATPFDYDFEGTVVDEVKWVDLQAVSPVNRLHFGNKTTIHTVTYATTRATAVKNRQLNCLAGRRIPKWTGSAFTGGFDAEGRHTWGTIHQTSLIHDIIAAVTLDTRIGNRPASELDMAQMQGAVDILYAIHPEAPTFNYTLDNDSMSFEETVKIIADAGMAIAYRQNGKIRLSADRKQTTSAALFTHKNKEPKNETITQSLVNDSGFDGVELTYQDPVSEQPEVIRLPRDGSAQRPKVIELPGMRSYPQAWLRANREFNKVFGRRKSIRTSCTTDARLLIPNARVDIVDNTLFRPSDGDVVKQSGLTLTLSQPVEFEPGQPHSIVLMDRDGTPLQGIPCLPGADPRQVVLQSLPTQPIVTSYGKDGIRTIFSFASDADREKEIWLVEEIDPPKGRYMEVRAFNYSDSYYAADTQPIPDRESVINS